VKRKVMGLAIRESWAKFITAPIKSCTACPAFCRLAERGRERLL
jgi:hypothetical protein